jgi:ArsR family transcriptional regulator
MDSTDVKAFFDQVATEWDDMRSSFYNARVIDALAEHVRPNDGDTIVDVGTGTGFVACGLSARVAEVVGVDNSIRMLEQADTNKVTLGVDNVALIAADLTRLPLPDDSVDGAIANMVLHHAPNPEHMLREMGRVVKPAGMVAVTDEVAHRYEWMRTEQADIWLGFTKKTVGDYFESAGLRRRGYARLGVQ